MNKSEKLLGARVFTGLLLIALVTLVILMYQEYSAELATNAELYMASSFQSFDTSLAVK
jgi:hypothetical protein